MRKLARAPSYPELSRHLAKALRGKRVISYNAQFDERLLHQTAQRNGGRHISATWICAMKQYAAFKGKCTKLPGNKHRALADCKAVLRLIKKMASARLSSRP
jgi:DNA polymerase III epsilon subunit-like protein